MAERDKITKIEYDLARIARQIAGMPVRIGKSAGGIGLHYQLIRGTTTTAVTPILAAFQIEAVSEFEEHAKAPGVPVGVAAPPGGVTLSEGDYVWAAYHKAFTTFDFGAGVVDVDWVMIPTAEGQSTPPLRRFELTVAKARTDATATGKWLDHPGAMVGDPVTLHDPGLRFYGKAADYVSGEGGFEGYALLRADLAETDPGEPRWEIVTMQGFAETVVATWVGSPTNEWQLDSFSGDQWEWRRPVADAAPLTISDPLSFPAAIGGEKRIFHLLDPDTSPPTYQVRTVKQDDRKVASGPTDTVPATLIEKLDNISTVGSKRLVEFEEFDDGGTRKVRGFMDVSDLGGGAPEQEVAEFAHVTLDGAFDYDELGVVGTAPVQSVNYSWGGDGSVPTITSVFDLDGTFAHHKSGDGIIVARQGVTDDWYAYHWQRPPQLLRADAETVAVPGETIVEPVNGIYTASVVRYTGGDPRQHGSYAVVELASEFFFVNGKTPVVKHFDRFMGFLVRATGGSRLYAVTAAVASGDLIPVLIHGAIPAATRAGPGPRITPFAIAAGLQIIERLDEDVNDDLVPSGEYLDAWYRSNEAIEAPPEGKVWRGEVTVSGDKNWLTMIDCEPWEV